MGGSNGKASPCDDAKPNLAKPITDTHGNPKCFTQISEFIACSIDTPKAVGGASTSCEFESGPSSSSLSFRKSKALVTGQGSSEHASAILEAETEASKVHWSELTISNVPEQEQQREHIALANREVYASLEKKYHFFFRPSDAEWVIGEKIAEGGQAEIYAATIVYPNGKKFDEAMKVFKLEDISLRDLENLWPVAFLQKGLGLQFDLVVKEGRLLDDGRFAFRMDRYWGDLRTRIDRSMQRQGNQGQPYRICVNYYIIRNIARGMRELHQLNIPHRGLKASNVLVLEHRCGCTFHVADYECNNGIIGTGFWRAPEILRALKDGSIHNRPELFSQNADVYSFAMTCYEVFTGKNPFQNVLRNNYEAVFRGWEQLEWPQYIDPKILELLEKCLHLESSKKPTFEDICKLLEHLSKMEIICSDGVLFMKRIFASSKIFHYCSHL